MKKSSKLELFQDDTIPWIRLRSKFEIVQFISMNPINKLAYKEIYNCILEFWKMQYCGTDMWIFWYLWKEQLNFNNQFNTVLFYIQTIKMNITCTI
jgi:hypothetical protein